MNVCNFNSPSGEALSLDEKELRTGTPGNGLERQKRAVACAPSWSRSQGGTGGQPTMKLPP